jgi:hypothetical protein
MTSAKAWFAAAIGRRVEKRVTGVLTLESWDAWLSDTIASLKAQGAADADIVSDESGLTVKSTGQFVLKPKLRALERGTLNVRSADYGFTPDGSDRPVYGDKKGAIVEGGKLVKRYPNGMVVTFETLEG